ncbi:MAG: CDP-diacylglycerol--glycerol-3-phosphate 3-phosphatidyltransferase [Erysipelotrichaceae bacterium]|nr:CDP-diacylglycerol--glycerol-3-phosphate 3-phosphatidyltransferase [Erysipelotrichaceae bacterium]
MNLPNKLTLVRLCLTPVFIAVFLIPVNTPSFAFLGTTVTVKEMIAFIIFAAASITDFFDGYIARRDHLITTFGKFVDPIADKILVNSALILLTLTGKIPGIILLIMIIRDTIVDAVRFLAASNHVVIAASYLGKGKTASQMIGICLLLLNNPIFAMLHIPMATIMIYVATAFSIVSGCDYLYKAKDMIFESI